MSNQFKTAGILALSAVFFIFDRALKWLFINIWRSAEFKIIGDWFSLKLSLNQGIAFSLPANQILIITFTILALIFLVYWAWQNSRRKNYILLFSIVLVIVGAYSNLLDRLTQQAVIDYFNLSHFSIFNLADVMIIGGMASAAFLTLRRKN